MITLPEPGLTVSLPAVPMKLDLRSLSQSDGPPSELQARREKYAFFEKQCSEVADGLFLGSDVVARNREVLRAANITHVINCVGFLYPPYFQDELTYLVLYLQGEHLSGIVCLTTAQECCISKSVQPLRLVACSCCTC